MLLSVDESGEITRAVIDRAKAGDMVAARFCLKQILPKRRSREIALDLPECRDIEGVVAAFDVTVAAMAAGEITPDEALAVSKVLERRRHALEAKALQANRGDDAAVVAASAEETLAPAVAPDLHPAYNNSANEAAAAPAEPMPAAPRGPFPTFASACIPPASRGPIKRHAGPFPPSLVPPDALPRGPPAMDCPPSSCFA